MNTMVQTLKYRVHGFPLSRERRMKIGETTMIDPTTFEDVLYEVRGRAAWVIINRPKLYNAFRAQTIEELIMAFKLAADDKGVSSVVLTGAGDKAFCTGGDQSAKDGQYDGRGIVGLPIDELQSIIRDIPKPVIARVNGFAIGGGNVFATLCDLTIAADTAKLGQVGPKVGSVDAGWGTAYLARIVGDKKAREMWYLNEQYTAHQAMEMGLVNKVVPAAELDDAVNAWTQTMGERSPTALALAKRSFNADSDNIRGISMLSLNAVKLYYDSEESKEGMRAFQEKRAPDFHKYVK
jgi:2-ketocyclohexanecarboxyl-CoA hydrolase